jgi:HTH-type transcriptional regulator/antitoxin HigA
MDAKTAAHSKKTAAPARTLPATYYQLVKRFPLTHVRDDAHMQEATGVIDRLVREDLDEGGQEYVDALTDLVETYEAEHVTIPDAPRRTYCGS